jgi:hypothetical protein
MKTVLVATLAIAAMAMSGAAALASNGEPHRVTICHFTGSATNPVVSITVDRASFDANPAEKGHYPPHHGEDGDAQDDYWCDPGRGGSGGGNPHGEGGGE